MGVAESADVTILTANMSRDLDEKIRTSWQINANAWTSVVRNRQIPSRNAGTDQAIVSAIAELPMSSLLDVGCGEGWLCRVAVEQGWRVTGIDGSAALIARAREHAGATYLVADYRELPTDAKFGCIVCNFAILSEHIHPLLTRVRDLLADDGTLLIQTSHPWTACGDQPYRDGWREETFQGWQERFDAPMPWYFRTLESWLAEISRARLGLRELREPLNPETNRPLSLLMICRALASE